MWDFRRELRANDGDGDDLADDGGDGDNDDDGDILL